MIPFARAHPAAASLALVPLAARAECIGCGDDIRRMIALWVYGAVGVIIVILFLIRWRTTSMVLLGLMVLVAIGPPLGATISQSRALRQIEAREIWASARDPYLGTPILLASAHSSGCYGTCTSIVKAAAPGGILALPYSAQKALLDEGTLDLSSITVERWRTGRDDRVFSTPVGPDEAAALAPRIDNLIVVSNAGAISRPGLIESLMDANPAVSGLPPGAIVRFALAPLATPGRLTPSELTFDILDLSLAGTTEPMPLWIGRPGAIANPLSDQAKAMIGTSICTGRKMIGADVCLASFQ